MKIQSITGLEILDSRGTPTVRAVVELENGMKSSASVPSGASTGSHEAVELRDNDRKRYQGKGVQQAVEHIQNEVAQKLRGVDISDPRVIDRLLIELDGTENKSRLGANTILAVSLAVHRAASQVANKSLWQFLNALYFSNTQPSFPRLMVNIVNGGAHASWNFDIQEFMIVPTTSTPSQSVRIASEIFHQLGHDLKAKNQSTLVGDEGGYSPNLQSHDEVFETIEAAAKSLGYERNKDFTFAVDCASTEWFKNGVYHLPKMQKEMTSQQLDEYYSDLGQRYNIQSFEDPFAEDDWEAFVTFSKKAKQFMFQVVGDDLFVTQKKRIDEGVAKQAATAVLIKLNQVGSVSETAEAINTTKQAGWRSIISHRSGETEDTFIADLAYASGSEFIKTGSMSRSERLAKYNRLLEIEKGL